MNYKKLLISSIVVMAALSSQVYAKELQAQVQKNTANAPKQTFRLLPSVPKLLPR